MNIADTCDRWELLTALRSAVNARLEEARQRGIIGSSLDAAVVLVPTAVPFAILCQELGGEAIREALVVSRLTLVDHLPDETREDWAVGAVVRVTHAPGVKCPRCWHWSEDANERDECPRCIAVMVDEWIAPEVKP